MKKIIFKITFLVVITNFLVAQNEIPKRSFAIDWVFPSSGENGMVKTNAKAEIAVIFPKNLLDSIQKFVQTGKGINPFDPEEIDIACYYKHEKDKEMSYVPGFYYESFSREIKNEDANKWGWKTNNEKNPFRVRFTPTKPGKWDFTIQVKRKGELLTTLGPFFIKSEDFKKAGFLKVHQQNSSYLTLDGKTFIPIGNNLPKAICYVERDSSGKITRDEYGCGNVPCASIEEWCGHLKDLPMNPKGFIVQQEEIKQLKNKGGNYYRMMIFPHTYEIEYERIGDYSKRLHLAWELDQLVELTDKLDLKLHLNLFCAYPLTKEMYGVSLWDWYPGENGDKGYCYQNELGLKEPHEFLTDERAKKYFKQKLRYIIARYGYSSAIGLFELVNEINNKFYGYGPEVFAWHKEMADYIKINLGHKQHLLTTNYVFGPSKGDNSYEISSFDVISYNLHRAPYTRNEIEKSINENKKYKKPILFSEIGTGDSNIDLCDNDVEWKKDLWLTLFSGSASAGINWNNAHKYNLWAEFKRAKEISDQINFEFFTKTQTKLNKEKNIEMLCLLNEKSTSVAGIIHNLTWNYQSMGEGKVCLIENKEIPKKNIGFRELANKSNKKGIFVTGLNKNKLFKITWYSTKTGKELYTEELNSDKKGRLILPHPRLSLENEMIVFSLYELKTELSLEKPIEIKQIKKSSEPKLNK